MNDRPLSLRASAGLALLAGLAMSMAFAPIAFGPYAIVSVALLTGALWRVRPRRGLGLGFVSGLVFFGILLFWIRVVGWDAWVLLSAFCALWFMIVGIGTALVTRLPGAPVWVASLWVLEEALRGRIPFGGFPWGNIAFAQPDTAFASWASVGGSPLVTFTVAFVGAAIVGIVIDYRAGRRRSAVLWSAAAVLAVVVPSLIPIPATGDTEGGPATATIAIVQGGTPQVGLGALDVRRAVLDNHVAQTLDLATHVADGTAAQPDFVLWPENASDIDPFTDPTAAASITAAARAVNAPILVGAVITPPPTADGPVAGVWNVGIAWDPESGPQAMYVKTHPVPFGEYIPFRDFLAEHIGRFDRIPNDFLPGDTPGNILIGGVPIGNVICFEVAYGEVVDAVVDGGARVITVQTNNATYGGTAQPEQQFNIERMRAQEFGRSVVVASTTGISAFIAPDGAVGESIAEDEVGWRVATVPLRGGTTLASRFGHWVEMLLCAIAVASIAVAVVRSRRRSRMDVA